MNCPFCHQRPEKVLLENEYFFAIRDIHPTAKGHSLIISKRHVSDFFESNAAEATALHDLSQKLRETIDREFSPDGYKLLMNCGAAAGQSVFHFHLHLIPRYKGDKTNIRRIAASLREVL